MAGYDAAVCHWYQSRHFDSTTLDREWATGMKRAPARRVDRAWHLAIYGRLQPNARRIRYRRRCDQRFGVGVDRLGEQCFAGCELHDSTEIHDRDAMGDMLHDAEVMRDEDEGDTHLLLEIQEQIQDLCLHGDVKG